MHRAWDRVRSSPWWVQALCWLVLPPGMLLLVTLTRAPQDRRPWWAVTTAATIAWVAVASASGGADRSDDVASAGDTTTTTEARTTTTERIAPTTTVPPEAPEGGRRAGTGDDVARSAGTDAVLREPESNELLDVLASLSVEAEPARTGYSRELFPQWDDDDHDGCDSRCEVLSAQRGSDGLWFSEWDGYSTDDPSELHVDHVVALAEAWDSGADSWSPARRDDFADDLPNLLAVTAASNMSKGDKDAAEWFPARAEANCLWASTVVRVKADWDLSVDPAERDALGNLLRTCEDYVPPTTTTTPAPATTQPPVVTTAAPARPAAPRCTAGYSPCIPPGDDVDCAGGTGDGPRYVEGPVYVDHGGGDPYDLDRDGNGVGCQS